ncbi:MAG: hypothetical protein LBC33_02760 [Mycoplasmataceae bacterium]|nr:hypothetical protein [Mycoplasmataceae bacterium]
MSQEKKVIRPKVVKPTGADFDRCVDWALKNDKSFADGFGKLMKSLANK